VPIRSESNSPSGDPARAALVGHRAVDEGADRREEPRVARRDGGALSPRLTPSVPVSVNGALTPPELD